MDEGEDEGGLLGVHQQLVQAARRGVGHDLPEDVQGRIVGVCGGGHVVGGHQGLHIAHAADGHLALAILGGVQGPVLFDGAGGAGDAAQDLVHEGQCLGLVDLASHHEGGVVGLVELLVEGAEVRDVDVLHVGPGTDGVMAVVVPLVGSGCDALHDDLQGLVLAALHLVADNGHLAFLLLGIPEVLGVDVGVDHAVSFQVEHELEVLVAGGKGHEVVGAIIPGAAIEAGADLVEGLHRRELAVLAAEILAGLEDQMLQQVGHAGLAVDLIERAHHVGDVGGDGGLAGIGEEQYPQAVAQPVFGDALDARDLHRSR